VDFYLTLLLFSSTIRVLIVNILFVKLIIGLGNPGKEYERTRHNAGFIALDALAATTPFSLQKKFQADVATIEKNGEKLILLKPHTFMNESGLSVRAALDFYKLTSEEIIVVHDDKDIPLGEFRIHKNRGSAGHNGIKSIIEHLGTKDFVRLRLGVAPLEHPMGDAADFVLSPFTKAELVTLKQTIAKALPELLGEV
jgi:PTH1 family peptidyl-tRNA hydrolase